MKRRIYRYEMSEFLFDKLLNTYSKRIRDAQHIHQKYYTIAIDTYGSGMIYTDGSDEIVCPLYLISNITNNKIKCKNPFKQVLVRMDKSLEDNEVYRNITGKDAFKALNKLLSAVYTPEEITSLLEAKKAHFDPFNKQSHYTLYSKEYISKFNVKKYDINGAHAAALMEIFPNAKDIILRVYKKRKKNKAKYKNLLNYYVGYLCKVGHRETYNWIVQRTNNILNKAVKAVGGKVIYINTDGFAVVSDKDLPISKKLGDWKEEYVGDCYVYSGDHYTIYKFGDEYKGNCPRSVRDKFDLEHGKVVEYQRVLNKDTRRYDTINIITKEVYVHEDKAFK